ncbi:hypothetical protein EIB96_14145 [Vibrio parahaemolyticus]|nr:hypothetical protein [Vibrio parahaemolyticus]EGR1949081.1 hypothetical protein [Vibrio parahaemolyticus]
MREVLVTKPSNFCNCKVEHIDISHYLPLPFNAALSGEQRRPSYLNHCAVNTKAQSNRKCQALGIRLKRFVSFIPKSRFEYLYFLVLSIVHRGASPVRFHNA